MPGPHQSSCTGLRPRITATISRAKRPCGWCCGRPRASLEEETFGPIVPATVIGDEEEAIRAVNSSPYGLLCVVFTRDLARGLRFAEAVRTGWVNINASSNHWESHLPFGEAGDPALASDAVGGRYAMEAFTELKTVIVSL